MYGGVRSEMNLTPNYVNHIYLLQFHPKYLYDYDSAMHDAPF